MEDLRLHRFEGDVAAVEWPRQFTFPFCYVPHRLAVMAAEQVRRELPRHDDWRDDLAAGKMLGVLVVADAAGELGFLAAYSGNLAGRNDHAYFVPPIVDLLDPAGEYKRGEAAITAINRELDTLPPCPQRDTLRHRRKAMSEALQRRLFELYVVRNAAGGEANLLDIWREWKHDDDALPPGGTGECCAPKLLQHAYLHGLQPLCMAEFFVCDPANNGTRENRNNGDYCQACEHKCRPLLSFMMLGLDVEPDPLRTEQPTPDQLHTIYLDDRMVVVDKPSGMLAVPGRDATVTSALEIMREHLAGDVLEVHRLDMATSGLLVMARDAVTQRALRRSWELGEVTKTYVAVLEGNVADDAGEIHLATRPDYEHRPRQVVDDEGGKRAVTRYEVIDREDGRTRVWFFPITGRTHQLRVHAAHRRGLAAPIVGDALYGRAGGRLLLHAHTLTLPHPVTGERVTFTAPLPF